MSVSILYCFLMPSTDCDVCQQSRLQKIPRGGLSTYWIEGFSYEWTESGSIADVRERYLLLKASLFVGIIDLISPRRSCWHSQSFGASTNWAWESCGIVSRQNSQFVHDQHFQNISSSTRGFRRSFSMNEVHCKQADWSPQCFLRTPYVHTF